MSTLFNEQEADAAVIETLLNNLAAYQRKDIMDNIVLFKSEDGQVKRAHNFENISRAEIEETIGKLRHELSQWESALAVYDSLEAPAPAAPQPVETMMPAEAPAPEVVPEAPVVEQPAPVEAPAPEAPAAPEAEVTQLPAPVDTPIQ